MRKWNESLHWAITRKSLSDRSAVEEKLAPVLAGEFKPLLIAASYGFTRLLGRILGKLTQARLEQKIYHEGSQSAVLATKHGYTGNVRLLLENGADINAEGGEHGTALQAASAEGHQEIVRMLLDKGADINVEGGNDGTALQAASLWDHTMIVDLLLDGGADIDAGGGRYGNALSAACSWNNQSVARILLDRGANLNTVLVAACRHDHIRSVRMLLNKGADANTRDERHKTALETASSRGNVIIVQLLLENRRWLRKKGQSQHCTHCCMPPRPNRTSANAPLRRRGCQRS
jgi:ankyrin repeat protein